MVPFASDSNGEPSKPVVLVVGAGIAGLSLALFLSKSGKFEVRLFERAPELSPALGAHFALNGALVCLDRAGLRHVWEPIYHHCSRIKFRRHRSQWKADVDMHNALAGTDFDGKFGVFMREELQAALARALPAGVLACGKELVKVQEGGDKVRIAFKDGSITEGDILLATDGINSSVRRLVFGDMQKVYSGYKIWYMISDDPPPDVLNSMTELSADNGTTLAFSAGSDPKHIVLVVQRGEEPTHEDLRRDSSVEHFHRLFSECGAYDANLVTEAKLRNAARLLHFGVYSMPPGATAWSSGRICLLGDSVHATTPFVGQGANQAVQSAFCVARLLEEHGVAKYREVFQKVHHIREPVASNIVSMSKSMAQFRIRSRDDGCFAALRRKLFYAVPRLAPKLFAKRLARAFEVKV